MRHIAALCITSSLIAACGQQQPAEAPAKEISVRSPEQKALFKLDEEQRAIGLKRALQDSKMPCKRVVGTRYLGTYKNMDMWAADCADERSWAIFVGSNNDVQVRLCADTEKVGLPSCNREEAPPPDL